MNLKTILLLTGQLWFLLNTTCGQSRLQSKASEALQFCKNHHYNTTFCILVDMRVHSGKARFYVVDLKTKQILKSSLVSHGCGNNDWSGTSTKTSPVFSSVDGSHCTALGKYKVGKRGTSQWGIGVNYLLLGLENSNRNSLARQIVLHSWHAVPETERYPDGTPEGWGCPAVSNGMMTYIDGMLKSSAKPVLLWIYY